MFNNIKSNIALPETRGSITARSEQPNTGEAEENNLENNFMKPLKRK